MTTTPNETPTPRTDASLWTYKASGAEMVYADFARQLERELNAERDALERERMRLCACGVVAICDTPESAKEARDMHPDYRSASCDDVARRVDECIRLRGELFRWKAVADELADKLEKLVKLDDEFQECDSTYENAYLCFYKGQYATWREARETLNNYTKLKDEPS